MNIGHSSRLPYDKCAYPDKLKESTDPLSYRLNTNQMYNCDRCLSSFGTRSGYMGHGVSTYRDIGYAEAQDLVDLDSIFSNRNVQTSKCKKGKINPINPLEFKLHNSKLCSRKLEQEDSRLSYPSSIYREMPINRFYNLIHDPQEAIFWNFETNSVLEEKDNFRPNISRPWPDLSGPKETFGTPETCKLECKGKTCPKSWKK